jgi:DNA-binding beta-propeller fold protein YncE
VSAKSRSSRAWLGALCAATMLLAAAAPGRAASDDPLWVFSPSKAKLPVPDFEGPCGLAVDSVGNFYVADYYHHLIDVFSSERADITQIKEVDPLDGPCGLALDAAGNLFVNNFHRNVERFVPSAFPPTKGSSFPVQIPKTTYAAAGTLDSSHPTGVAVDPASGTVYVNARTQINAYEPSGALLGVIGAGAIADGYGLALSGFPATAGYLYVPDAADRTVKVFDPATDTLNPVATIAGPGAGFASLHDSAIAVDRQSGEVYVADTLGSQYSASPQARIEVFAPSGAYQGHLKYNVIDGGPSGLAVDNSATASQGRVYVTSGNSEASPLYAYPPGAATTAPPLPPSFALKMSSAGNGAGVISSELAGLDCSSSCTAELPAGAALSLSATPAPGSEFSGWSGAGCAGSGICVVQMSAARSLSAEFTAPGSAGPAPQIAGPPAPSSASAPPTASRSVIAQRGSLRVRVSGRLAPRSLPRDGQAPIAVTVGGEISTTDHSDPPQLKTLRIELNRHGHLQSAGLPSCPYEEIQPASSARALAACRPALVGTGHFSAEISLAGQAEPYPTRGRMLLFNARRGGRPLLYGQIYAARPFATSFVIVFKISRLQHGTYGTVLSAFLPRALGEWGNLTGIEMTLSRRYSDRGRPRSYLSAGCPVPSDVSRASFALARTSFGFPGARTLTSVLGASCRARR